MIYCLALIFSFGSEGSTMACYPMFFVRGELQVACNVFKVALVFLSAFKYAGVRGTTPDEVGRTLILWWFFMSSEDATYL